MATKSQGYGALQASSTLTVAVITILLGVPLWWKTTTVYRADLPYERINNVTDLLNPLHFTIDISVDNINPSIDIENALKLSLNTQVKGSGKIAVQYRVEKNFDGVRIITESSRNNLNVVELSGNNLHVQFDYTDAEKSISEIVSVFTNTLVVPKELELLAENTMNSANKKTSSDRMRVLKSSSGYHLSFTLLVADPQFCQVQWNIEDAVEDVLNPFLDQLGGSRFANFTIESQVNYYSNLKLPVKAEGRRKFVSVKYLPEAISHAEAKLVSHISQLPDVNFLIYIPKREEYPLYIKDTKGMFSPSNAFLSPQWGGVVVYNPQEVDPANQDGGPITTQLDMKALMPVFISQLRALLGVPEWKPTPGVHIPPLPAHQLHDWQVHRLLRNKLVENLLTASSTLTSLVKLLDKVQNMVISDRIQQLVESSVSAIYESTMLLREGDLHNAYEQSVNAMVWAETAFFDQSILELLYFPDDQKYGVYVPLFVPLCVPIVLSTMKAIRWLRKSKEMQDQSSCQEEN